MVEGRSFVFLIGVKLFLCCSFSNMDGIDTSKLKVSLEPHLLKILKPLPDLLPLTLAEELKIYVSDVSSDTIPYSTLLTISQWSRTLEGREKLEAYTLNPNDYMMVSLLAGVKTSPERNFGAYVSLSEPEQLAEQQKRERQEITAIIDGLLSVLCVGFATWWASDKLHWQNHWVRILTFFISHTHNSTARVISTRHNNHRCSR